MRQRALPLSFASKASRPSVLQSGSVPNDTVWNDGDYAQRLAHANWMANTAVLMHLNERATGDPARDWLSSWAHRWFVGDALRVLVLGCGEGWLERAVAQWPFVARIDAVDFAEHAIARARDAAKDIPKIHYGVLDLNRDELPPDTYDVVVAHSVLHHVEHLEHAYPQLERTMKRDATLIVNEYVGPNRFQFSDDVLSIMNALLQCIAPGEVRTRPRVDEMIAHDPTEAVRAEEVLPFTHRHFEVLEQKNIGGTILQHLLFELVQRFRFEVPRERSILEMLCTIEAMLIDTNRIPCDFVILAARKKGSRVTKTNRPLPRRAEGADDIDPDPLTRISRFDRLIRGARLNGTQRRLLRLALLATQPRRANLYDERAHLFGGADPWSWIQRHTPPDPTITRLIDTAATLAQMR